MILYVCTLYRERPLRYRLNFLAVAFASYQESANRSCVTLRKLLPGTTPMASEVSEVREKSTCVSYIQYATDVFYFSFS